MSNPLKTTFTGPPIKITFTGGPNDGQTMIDYHSTYDSIFVMVDGIGYEYRKSGPHQYDFFSKTSSQILHCYRCGWEGPGGLTDHKDGIYCPKCPTYKNIHASLSVVSQ